MAGMGSMTECSDPSVQNKMAVTECSALRVGDDGKLYCLCEPGRKTMCEECTKAVSRVIGDKNKRLNKMEGMESMTDYSTPILDPSVHLEVGDYGKSYCLCEPSRKTMWEECARAVSRVIVDKNKCKIHSQLNKMTDCSAPIIDPSVHLEVGDDGKLYCLCEPGRKTMCEECARAVSHVIVNKNKCKIQSQLNKMVGMESVTHSSALSLWAHPVDKNGKLYYMCEKGCQAADAQSYSKQEDENNILHGKILIQLNKMVVIESLPDWSGLLTDLLVEIAVKLSVIEDFTAFRGVCTSWRAAVTKEKFVSVSKVPLLMLAEKDGDGDIREFYSLCKRKIFTRMPVPGAKGKRCIGVGFGWVLTVATSGGELNLVKPMSSSKIQLPNMMTFPEYEEYQTMPEHLFVGHAVLSANPSDTSDFMLMVAFSMNVCFWRNGDSHWTKLEFKGSFANIGFYKNKMYVISEGSDVWMWDPYLAQEPEIIFKVHADWLYYLELAYFVESSKGELLLITRTSAHRHDSVDYCYFGVFQIDTVNKTYTEIDTLDQDAIFVGQNVAAVSAADFPGVVKANHIYFTDDDCTMWPYVLDIEGWVVPTDPLSPGTDMGIYNVEDGVVERFDVESSSFICTPFWIFPSL